METQAVGSSTPTATTVATNSNDQLESEDFFQLLVTELQQQDPLEPTKTADMVNQVSQIRSIEVSQQLMSTLEQLTQQQRTSGTSDLLGKYVEADVADDDGNIITLAGIVTSVQFTSDGTALLELDTGDVVRAQDVTRVTSLEVAAMLLGSDAADEETDKTTDTARVRQSSTNT
ncbi:MAG: flagellar hook capping FlgD N-terminal domain-containing protein [Phycisphaerae bacterium]|jgi:flagellar basal-body rod modification protein FlgD